MNRDNGFFVLIVVILVFCIGCIEKQEPSNNPVENEPPPTPRILPQPNSEYAHYLRNWEPDDISELEYGFCAGTTEVMEGHLPCVGYHLPFGSVIYHLRGDVTKVYTIDNTLHLNVNNNDIDSKVPVRSFPNGGSSSGHSTYSISLTRPGVIGGKGFVKLIDYSPGSMALLMIVHLDDECKNEKYSVVDNSLDVSHEVIGRWQVVSGDIDISTNDYENPKIYHSKHYSIQPTEKGNGIVITLDFGQTIQAVANGKAICLEIDGVQVLFHIYDYYNGFVAFYEDGNSYVQQLEKIDVGSIIE